VDEIYLYMYRACWKQYFIDLDAYSGPRVREGPPLHHLNNVERSCRFWGANNFERYHSSAIWMHSAGCSPTHITVRMHKRLLGLGFQTVNS